jgi:MFS family permease
MFWLSGSVGVSMVGLGIIWPLIPVYATQLGAQGAEIGMIIASFSVARSLSNPLIGKLCDVINHKRLIIAGLLLYTLVSFLYIAADRTYLLVVVRLLHGFASAFVIPVAMASAALLAPKKQLGKYLGTLNMAVMVGMGTGPIIGGMINDLFGIKHVFILMGAFSFLTLVGAQIGIPHKISSPTVSQSNPTTPIRHFFHHRPIQGLLLLRFFASVGQGAVYTFLPVLAHQINLIGSQIGAILSINIFTIAFLQRFLGSFADRVNAVPTMVMSTILSGIAVAFMPMDTAFYSILGLNIIMAVANAAALSSGFVLAGRIGFQLGMGSVMGLLDTARSLGFMISPVFLGIILDQYGIAPVFYFGGVIIILGCVLSFTMLNKRDYSL